MPVFATEGSRTPHTGPGVTGITTAATANTALILPTIIYAMATIQSTAGYLLTRRELR